MNSFQQADWSERCAESLKPGWRGRLRVAAPDEAENPGHLDTIVGTVVDAEAPELDPDTDLPVDALIRVCSNHVDGQFLPTAGRPCMNVRLSQVVAMQAL